MRRRSTAARAAISATDGNEARRGRASSVHGWPRQVRGVSRSCGAGTSGCRDRSRHRRDARGCRANRKRLALGDGGSSVGASALVRANGDGWPSWSFRLSRSARSRSISARISRLRSSSSARSLSPAPPSPGRSSARIFLVPSKPVAMTVTLTSSPHAVVDDGAEDDVRLRVGGLLDHLGRLVDLEQAEVAAAGDVEQDAAGALDVDLEQRAHDRLPWRPRRRGSRRCRRRCPSCCCRLAHDRLDVREVEVDEPGHGDQVADALHALAQHVVDDAEGVDDAASSCRRPRAAGRSGW